MAEENKKVPIAYATMPVEVTKEDGTKEIIYRKIHPITTGNAVVVRVGGVTVVLNKILAQLVSRNEVYDIAAMDELLLGKQDDMGLTVADGCICQIFEE